MIAHVIEHGPFLSHEPRSGKIAAGRGVWDEGLKREATVFFILEQSGEQALPITLRFFLSTPLTVLF